MQITILGANGKVGRIVTQLALDKGHSVNALVHSHSSLKEHDNLTIYKGDINDPESILPALKGSSVVVSCLSSWKAKPKTVLSTATQNLLPLLNLSGINRIITLTGADARSSSDELSLIHKLSHSLIKIVGKAVLDDSEKHISLLEESRFDYTVVRSPIMNDYGKASYKLSDQRPLPWETINRRAVALAIVDLLDTSEQSRQAPYIKR